MIPVLSVHVRMPAPRKRCGKNGTGTGRGGQAEEIIDAVSEHFTDREEANRLAGICNGRAATVPSIERRTKTVRPPKLYDLTTLQRDANRLFGLTAGTTLRCAQALYESKLITYPRTDSRYLTDDMGQTATDVLKACFQTFPFLSQAEAASTPAETSASVIPSVQGADSPNIGRLLDSRKVSDHHAIIPTVMIEKTDLSTLDKDQKKILTLIASRLVCATGQSHVYETVKATLLCCGYPFAAMGRIVKEEGWKAAETAMLTQCRAFSDEGKEERESASSGQDLSTLYQGAQFPSANTKVTEHWTQPLNQYTEDTLLHAMEKAGASDMEADVERKGLGTPATRAGIIDKLVSSKYVSRNKRQLIATEAGRQLIEILPAYLTSLKMTADWENQLLMMERGEQDRQSFMGGITQLISQMLQECRQISDDDKQRFSASGETIQGNHTRGGVGKCPVCGSPVYEGDKTFYCSNRDCSFVLWKHNHYLDRLRTALNSTIVQDLLEKGRTTVKNLYSVKKDSYFTADLLMEWKDNKAAYSLEFPKH